MDHHPPQTPAVQTPDQERTERHLRNLSEMVEIGMNLIRVAQEQILQQIHTPTRAPAHPLLGHDLGLTVTRLARMVRQTMALEQYFATPQPHCLLTTTALTQRPQTTEPPATPEPADRPEPADGPERPESAERPQTARAERLLADLNEHLTIPDIAKLLAQRPLAAIVAELCEVIGVNPADCGWTPDLLAEPPPSPDPTPPHPQSTPAQTNPQRAHQPINVHDPP